VDEIVAFLAGRLAAWQALMVKPETRAVLALLAALVVVDLWRRGWKMSWSRRAIRGVAATVAIFHLNLLCLPLVWICAALIDEAYAALGVPSIDPAFWSAWPAWALVVVALVSHDFANYWSHRLMHMRWLWPVHAIHHSDPDVNGLSAYRVHALETVVMWGSYTFLLTWMGLPADAIGIGAIFLALHIVYVHVDVDWDHGPFRMWLASPRFHRWHHADVRAAYGKNLAGMFPVFDRLFGTYYEAGRCDAPLGAPGVPANDVVKLMLFPFAEWTRLTREALARGAARSAAVLQRISGRAAAR
jgi:sterol desaturase/sphingolipid hydroxylase (fatty acid hydroxylase superfamily)